MKALPINHRIGVYVVLALTFALLLPAVVQANPSPSQVTVVKPLPAQKKPAKAAAQKVKAAGTEKLAPTPVKMPTTISVVTGGVRLMKLPFVAARVAVGNPDTLDYTVVSPTQLYFLGKELGTTTVIIWDKQGRTYPMEAIVSVDIAPLQRAIKLHLPKEQEIDVATASGSIVLSGAVSDTLAMEAALRVSEAYLANQGSKKPQSAPKAVDSGALQKTAEAVQPKASTRVINLLKVRDPQQVLLEVRIAEVSKTLLERFGLNFSSFAGKTSTDILNSLPTLNPSGSVPSGVQAYPNGIMGVDPALGALTYLLSGTKGQVLQLDAKKQDDLVKILAEPTIVAMSGKEGSFLSGGQTYIPIPTVSGSSPTLQLTEFGIKLKFIPTVLDGGRIDLQVSPEVSEPVNLGQNSLPVFSIRKVSSTVQLKDGETLVIGGLLKNNVKENINALPFLGQIPILGALFRSSEFVNDKSELVVVVSPRLVKPSAEKVALPTDKFVPPTRSEFFLEGKLEGSRK